MRHFTLMTFRAQMPAASKILGLLCYEDLVAAQDDRFDWPVFDENTASSLRYTWATQDNPKGMLNSHRSTDLHTGTSALPVVPMVHVNAWGLPGSACIAARHRRHPERQPLPARAVHACPAQAPRHLREDLTIRWVA